MHQVYSPHTAVDAAPGGLGDWLADIVTGTLSEPEPATRTADPEKSETASFITEDSDWGPAESDEDPFVEKAPEQKTPKQRPGRIALQRTYSKPTYPAPMGPEQTDLAPCVSLFIKYPVRCNTNSIMQILSRSQKKRHSPHRRR